jgi:hypothetical protein
MADTRIPTVPSGSRVERTAGVRSLAARLVGRITALEWIIGGLVAALMLVLVVIEPDILQSPAENSRTILFTVGGTAAAAVALVVMLWLNVPAILRILVLWVPFAIVSWWLISPFFIDDVVDEDFSTSIVTQLDEGEEPATPDPELPGNSSASPDTRARATPASSRTPTDPTFSGSRTSTSRMALTSRSIGCRAPTRRR